MPTKYVPFEKYDRLVRRLRKLVRRGTPVEKRDALAAVLGLHGLRITEVRNLLVGDLDHVDELLLVRTLKRGKVRQVRLGPGVFAAVKRLAGRRPKEATLFVTNRGVFFGYATDTEGETIKLTKARNCVYWSADVKGFLGLASTGPTKSCRIGPPADLTLRNITAVAEVTEAAAQAWESAPWN